MLRRMIAICAAAALTACPGPYGDGFFGELPEFQAGGGAPPIEWPAAPAVPEAEPLQGDACLWNGDCPADAYCRRPAGRCFGPGVCQRPAEDCGPEAPPVCGCLGITFANRCEAAARRTNVAYLGTCGAICTEGADCPAGDVCRKAPDRVIGNDGTCGPRPSDCGQVNRICMEFGGGEVQNECEAMESDTWVVNDRYCFTGDYQGEAMDICDMPLGTCGQRVMGRCETLWENDMCEWNIVNGDPEPVCGCDGRTYAAACRAAWNGAQIDHAGACAPDAP